MVWLLDVHAIIDWHSGVALDSCGVWY